jgi:hypothetical protein
MNNAVEIHQSRAVVDAHTASEIKAQVHRIQEVMQAVMKPEMHYGKIPGTNKPTLYKAGSEVLLSTFRISVEPEVVDMSTSDEIRYQVRARGVHMSSGVTVGIGIGEASSNEDKYKWRAAVCDEEYNDTDEDRRRVKYGWRWGEARGEKLTTKTKQVRANPSDIANTILKMAKKRAQIDLTLTALAASDIFTQDIEDLPENMRDMGIDEPENGKPKTDAPKATESGSKAASEKQIGLVKVKLGQSQATEAELCKHLDIESVEAMPFAKVNEALAFLKEHTE